MIETIIVFLLLLGILSLSVFLNILLMWYVRGLLTTLVFYSENLDDLLQILDKFNKHIKSVYELETFYGDEILQSLLQHAGEVMQQLEEFEEIINFSEDEEELEGNKMNEQENESDQTNTDDKNTENPEIPSQIRVTF